MAPKKQQKSQDVFIRSQYGGITFEACPNDQFLPDSTWSTSSLAPPPTSRDTNRALWAEFKYEASTMILWERIELIAQPSAVVKYGLVIPPASFAIVHHQLVRHDNRPNPTYEILLKMHDATLGIEDEAIIASEPSHLPDSKKVQLLGWNNRQILERSLFVRVRFLDAASNPNISKFRTGIEQILAASHLPSLAGKIEEERSKWKQALEKEDEVRIAQLASWKLPRAELKVLNTSTPPIVELGKRDDLIHWEIQDFTTVYIRAESDDENNVFHEKKAPTWNKSHAWVAEILPFEEMTNRSRRRAKILNHKDIDFVQATLRSLNGPQFPLVVEPFEEDRDVEKQLKALEHFKNMAALQRGEHVPGAAKRANLHIQSARLFVDDPRHHPHAWKLDRFELKSGFTHLDRPDTWTEAQHQALRTVFAGRGGVSGAIGPPGTGKTTTLGRIPPQVLRQFKLRYNRIAVCAQSNQAVNEAVLKIARGIRECGQDPTKILVHVLSQGSLLRNNTADVENPALGTDIEPFSIWEHCSRRAVGEEWDAWHKGHDLLRSVGRIEDPDVRREHRKQQVKLFDMVKNECSIFACTLGTASGQFFAKDLNEDKFFVDLLMVDEASQVNLPSLLFVMQMFDPRRLFLAGDPDQLGPYCASDDAAVKAVVQYSPLERLQDRGIKLPLLNIEFRMPWNLYAATSNTFYGGKVSSASSTRRSPTEKKMRDTLRRIEVRTGQKTDGSDWVRLLNTGLVFNLVHSKSEKLSGSTSRFNMPEATFVKHLASALNVAGLPPKFVMQLTAYQAQYDALRKADAACLEGKSLVRKVDGSQGGEATAVIVTPVISNPHQPAGFMGDSRRVNVITSRQMHALFLVCSADTLCPPYQVAQRLTIQERKSFEKWADYIDNFGVAQREAMKELGIANGQWRINIALRHPEFRVDGVPVVPKDEIVYVERAGPSRLTGGYSSAVVSSSSTLPTSGPAAATLPQQPPPPPSPAPLPAPAPAPASVSPPPPPPPSQPVSSAPVPVATLPRQATPPPPPPPAPIVPSPAQAPIISTLPVSAPLPPPPAVRLPPAPSPLPPTSSTQNPAETRIEKAKRQSEEYKSAMARRSREVQNDADVWIDSIRRYRFARGFDAATLRAVVSEAFRRDEIEEDAARQEAAFPADDD